jgi:trehalose/maltose hydrolase-like predicted phosphorylase
MRWVKLLCVLGAALTITGAAAGSAGAQGSGTYVLTATSTQGTYAPTFTGNGWLGVRVPATGQGYAGGTVPAQSELAGFYAKPTKPKKISDAVQQRANIPTWSTLTFADGGQPFSLTSGTTAGWRQSIDLHTGIVTTSATWKAPDGHRTKLVYQVLTDRADQHLGLVTLQLTPRWSGTATVTDAIDGSPATLTAPVSTGFNGALRQDYVAVATQTTHIEAAIASQLTTSSNIAAVPTEVDRGRAQSIGQQLNFPVTANRTYTITKYVGIDDSQDTASPVPSAQAAASAAAAAGFSAAVSANDAAWSQLWNGRIDVRGNRTVATDVNASQFYLWSSTREGVDWSVSPAGLSSNGYDGHIFWDAETWMYPSLLAQHPELAAGMNGYRFQRLTEAQQHAAATGYAGARFPWESALDGTEQIPPPVSVNSEGVYEMHITADVALAGDLRRGGVLGLEGDEGRGRALPHRPCHRPRRGEPERRRRGLHQRRRQDDAPGRDPGRHGDRDDAAGELVPDRRRARGPDGQALRRDGPPRVRRLRPAARQAGRRDAPAVPVAGPDAGHGGRQRHQLLRPPQ